MKPDACEPQSSMEERFGGLDSLKVTQRQRSASPPLAMREAHVEELYPAQDNLLEQQSDDNRMSDAEPEPTINNLSQAEMLSDGEEDDDEDEEDPLDKSVLPDRDGESDLEDDAQEIVETRKQSMRSKHKLNRQHKLNIPGHMRHIYNLFHNLDLNLNMLKSRRQKCWYAHSEMQHMIEKTMKRNFTIAQFQ